MLLVSWENYLINVRRSFFLVPKAQLVSYIVYKDEALVGGSNPISSVTGIAVPEYTVQFRRLKLNDRGQETLNYNGPPKKKPKAL